MTGLLQRAAIALGLLALCACARTTNDALCPGATAASAEPCYNPDSGYRFVPQKGKNRNTFIVLTFSGGGIRAAALAYGTLQALKDLPGAAGEGSLLDEVDVISSVSGGSVTAAWYALGGRDGLSPENKLDKFLHEGGGGKIRWAIRLLNPLALARYAFTPYQRSDVLAEFFSDRLYGEATYDEVLKKYKEHKNQPFVILNATDFGHETRFPFTQNRFDLICSDLGSYKLAYAVAASANFPIVFTAIGLRNYSIDCPAHRDARWVDRGPPHWIKTYSKYDTPDAADTTVILPRSDGLGALRAARQAREYIDIDSQSNDQFLHLIDGGVVDNLGIESTLALEDEAECSPGAFQRLKKPRPPGYERIKEVLYIVVNARERFPAGIDSSTDPPDVFSSVLRVIDTSLDNTILGTQNYLTAELQAIAAPHSTYSPPGISADPGRTCWSDRPETKNEVSRSARDDTQDAVKTRIITIDFEMIPQRPCRDKFWHLGTTWKLPKDTIGDLIMLPKVLLRLSGELTDVYQKDLARPPPDFDKIGFPKDFRDVCAVRGDR